MFSSITLQRAALALADNHLLERELASALYTFAQRISLDFNKQSINWLSLSSSAQQRPTHRAIAAVTVHRLPSTLQPMARRVGRRRVRIAAYAKPNLQPGQVDRGVGCCSSHKNCTAGDRSTRLRMRVGGHGERCLHCCCSSTKKQVMLSAHLRTSTACTF